MIVNIPTAEELDDTALRLHFAAWDWVVRIKTEFDKTFDPAEGRDYWREEWADYLAASQSDLQSVCVLVQQSNELALKARICSVSPYLLLIRSDPKFSSIPRDVDFAEYRTLDAVDLPAAVNTICSERLSDEYIQNYDKIRKIRNKITHLGRAGELFQPDEFIRILMGQYVELWKDRQWLAARIHCASAGRMSFFEDDRYGTSHSVVLEGLKEDIDLMTGSEFQAVFGHEKSKRRYLCHACIADATTKFFEPDTRISRTAYLDREGTSLSCAMCGMETHVRRVRCMALDCPGDVIASEGEYVGRCHTCGGSERDTAARHT